MTQRLESTAFIIGLPSLRSRLTSSLNPKSYLRMCGSRGAYMDPSGMQELSSSVAAGYLVVAAITLWNTTYLERATESLRKIANSRSRPAPTCLPDRLGAHQSHRRLHLAHQ
jgi:hypothetical protein